MIDETDLDDPFGGEPADDDNVDPPEPAAPAKPAAAAPAAAAPAADPALEQLANIGLAALKDSWVAEAKEAGYAATNYDAIGLTGLDENAKAAFLATAKESHEAEIARLTSLGFVYSPEKSAEQLAADKLDAEEQTAAIAWGNYGPSVPSTGDKEQDEKIVAAAQRGDVRGVIAGLPGLGDFFARGKRPV